MAIKPAHKIGAENLAASTLAGGLGPASSQTEESLPPALARRAVETFTLEKRTIEADLALSWELLKEAGACFVCIKTAGRKLRGCIGTVQPTKSTLAEEIIVNAISAATRDPRFPPISAGELPSLRYSVDVLEKPEATRFEDLDPAEFGVIVEDNTGRRRGLLLPAIEGVETALEQVQIAARKAGIAGGEPLQLYRFRVRRFREAM